MRLPQCRHLRSKAACVVCSPTPRKLAIYAETIAIEPEYAFKKRHFQIFARCAIRTDARLGLPQASA